MLSVRKLLNESVFQPQTGSFQNVARSRRTSAWCTCLKRANNGLFHHFLYFFLSRCFFFFVNLFGLENGPVFFFSFFFQARGEPFREAAQRVEQQDTNRKISFSRDTRWWKQTRHLFIRGALVARASGTKKIDASRRTPSELEF